MFHGDDGGDTDADAAAVGGADDHDALHADILLAPGATLSMPFVVLPMLLLVLVLMLTLLLLVLVLMLMTHDADQSYAVLDDDVVLVLLGCRRSCCLCMLLMDKA